MTDAIETIEHHGCTIEIYYDPDGGQSCNPRDWDGASPVVMSHRRFNFANDAEVNFDDFGSWQEVGQHLLDDHDALAVLPIYMIDHSGVALRVGRDFRDCDPGGWDSGQVGLVYVTQADLDKWGCDSVDAWREGAPAEIENYGEWLNGEVYGYAVLDPDGDNVGGCWGFVGSSSYSYMLDEAKAEAESGWIAYNERVAQHAAAMACGG